VSLCLYAPLAIAVAVPVVPVGTRPVLILARLPRAGLTLPAHAALEEARREQTKRDRGAEEERRVAPRPVLRVPHDLTWLVAPQVAGEAIDLVGGLMRVLRVLRVVGGLLVLAQLVTHRAHR
jgi:hypothetical protein